MQKNIQSHLKLSMTIKKIYFEKATVTIPTPWIPSEKTYLEIETKSNIFDDGIINLMDFNCEQRESVHFFYTLPYSKNKALIESTWLSKMNDNSQKDYDNQIKEYIEKHLKIKNYKM